MRDEFSDDDRFQKGTLGKLYRPGIDRLLDALDRIQASLGITDRGAMYAHFGDDVDLMFAAAIPFQTYRNQ